MKKKREAWETNRTFKTRPHDKAAERTWCNGCDAALVHVGTKCHKCGNLNNRAKRFKKDDSRGDANGY